MSCERWNDAWVGALYDELAGPERQAMERHLADCRSCRERLESLSETRELLRAAAPAIPQAPPLRLAPERGLRRPLWAFAAGVAAAAAVFALGLFVGTERARATVPPPSTDSAQALPVADDLLARLDRLETRLAEATRPVAEPQAAEASTTDRAFVTGEELDRRLDRLERSLQVARARDMEFVLGEIQATEWRAGNWVDETRDALRRVALQADRRISQR